MPRIILKHKSPEFADPNEKQDIYSCEMPNCPSNAEHKAPKHRALNEYYRFCADHVKEYNKAWDFFSGMSAREVQDHMTSSRYGDRPTWKHAADKDPEEELYKAAKNTYGGSSEEKTANNKRKFDGDTNTPEYEAMAIMGLAPPVTLDEIKSRYKTLAKKHHPDLNRNDPNADEELLKTINMSYTILKLAFKEFHNDKYK